MKDRKDIVSVKYDNILTTYLLFTGNAFHKFYVNCSGWKNGVDVEPKLLFDYAYQLRDVITPLSTNTSTLPPGDCNNNYTIKFIVYIRNKFGATAEQQLIVIVSVAWTTAATPVWCETLTMSMID